MNTGGLSEKKKGGDEQKPATKGKKHQHGNNFTLGQLMGAGSKTGEKPMREK